MTLFLFQTLYRSQPRLLAAEASAAIKRSQRGQIVFVNERFFIVSFFSHLRFKLMLSFSVSLFFNLAGFNPATRKGDRFGGKGKLMWTDEASKQASYVRKACNSISWGKKLLLSDYLSTTILFSRVFDLSSRGNFFDVARNDLGET